MFNCSLMTCPVGALSTGPGRAQEEQEEDLEGVGGLSYYHYYYRYYYLREFGSKLSVIAAPLCEVSWLRSAVSPLGQTGPHVAKTLRFSRFIALPPAPLAIKAFLTLNRVLLRVWRTGVLQTSFFLKWIGLRAP